MYFLILSLVFSLQDIDHRLCVLWENDRFLLIYFRLLFFLINKVQMNSFACLSVLRDKKGGLGNWLSGRPHFVVCIYSALPPFRCVGSLWFHDSHCPFKTSLKFPNKSFLLENLQEEFIWVLGQILRSPSVHGMTTPGALEEPENELNWELCCNFPS